MKKLYFGTQSEQIELFITCTVYDKNNTDETMQIYKESQYSRKIIDTATKNTIINYSDFDIVDMAKTIRQNPDRGEFSTVETVNVSIEEIKNGTGQINLDSIFSEFFETHDSVDGTTYLIQIVFYDEQEKIYSPVSNIEQYTRYKDLIITPTPTPTPVASCSDCLKDCTATYNGELATSACVEGDPGQFWVWQEEDIEYTIYLFPGRTYGYSELGCDVACYSKAYHIPTGATRTFQWSMIENYDANGCLQSLTVDGEGVEIDGYLCGGSSISGWDACLNGSDDYDCSTLTPPTPSGIVYTCVDISTPAP